MYAGQGVGTIDTIEPAAAIVERFAAALQRPDTRLAPRSCARVARGPPRPFGRRAPAFSLSRRVLGRGAADATCRDAVAGRRSSREVTLVSRLAAVPVNAGDPVRSDRGGGLLRRGHGRSVGDRRGAGSGAARGPRTLASSPSAPVDDVAGAGSRVDAARRSDVVDRTTSMSTRRSGCPRRRRLLHRRRRASPSGYVRRDIERVLRARATAVVDAVSAQIARGNQFLLRPRTRSSSRSTWRRGTGCRSGSSPRLRLRRTPRRSASRAR